MTPRVTLEMVARKARVAKSTVSYALRKSPLLAASTIAKVQRAAEELGYRPNPLTSLLMGGVRRGEDRTRSAVLGLLNLHPRGRQLHDYESDRIEGARARAEQLGFSIEEFLPRERGIALRRLHTMLQARGIAGLLIPHLPPDGADDFGAFDWSRYAVAATGFTLTHLPMHRAAGFQLHNMRLAYERLHDRGFRRIGLSLNIAADQRVDHMWRAGFTVAQHTRQGCFDEESLFTFDDPTFAPEFAPADRQLFFRWLRRFKPDALIINSSREHTAVVAAGLRVPADVSLVLITLKPARMAGFAGIDRNSHRVGAAAVDLVAEQLARSEFGLPATPKTVLIEGFWRDGWTCRATAPDRSAAPRKRARRGS